MNDTAGESTQAVPGRILGPLLEKGSLEDDADLKQKWAALLAAASSARRADSVLPAYVHILAELSPQDVKILDFIRLRCVEDDQRCVIRPGQFLEQFPDIDYFLTTDNFIRLNLLMRPGNFGLLDAIARLYHGPLYLTSLRFSFLNACNDAQYGIGVAARPAKRQRPAPTSHEP